MNERRIKDIKSEISNIDITKTPGRNIATFNHTARRLWQLSNQHSNPITDLFTKVKDAYMQCAKAPAWLSFIEAQNQLDLSFDAYLDAAEDKYRWHLKNTSWEYKESDTSVIPKKSRTEVPDDTIAMPAIQQSQLNVAHKLSPHSKPMSGSKRLPQGIVKKKRNWLNSRNLTNREVHHIW